MSALFGFMASTAGRATRAVLGLVLVVLGIVMGGGGLVLTVVGLVPLAAGVFDVCLFAPLFHQPLRGADLRKAVAR
jgi:hypothetical protein